MIRVPGRSSRRSLERRRRLTPRREKHGHHRRRTQVVCEQVGLDERSNPGEALLAGQRFRLTHQTGVDLDACGTNAESLAGGDNDAAIAGAQIDQHVRWLMSASSSIASTTFGGVVT